MSPGPLPARSSAGIEVAPHLSFGGDDESAIGELLKLYRSNYDADNLLKKATNEGQIDPTIGYGLASYYQHSGNLDKANELFLLILESPNWNSFGYIAAEAELKTIFPVP